jgi:hypothetical protein
VHAFCWFALDRQVPNPVLPSPRVHLQFVTRRSIGSNEVVLWWNRRALNVQAAVSLAEHDLLQDNHLGHQVAGLFRFIADGFLLQVLRFGKILAFPSTVLLWHATPA